MIFHPRHGKLDFDVKRIPWFHVMTVRTWASQTVSPSPVYLNPKNLFRTPTQEVFPIQMEYTTKTVYGFSDFTTTMGNTVMVFKPGPPPVNGVPSTTEKLAPSPTEPEQEFQLSSSFDEELPTPPNLDRIFAVESTFGLEALFAGLNEKKPPNSVKSFVNVVTQVGNHLEDLQTSPSEPKVDVSSKVDVRVEVSPPHNDSPKKGPKTQPRPNAITTEKTKAPQEEEGPLGLVTTLGGTTVMNGLTTVHETKVIGTRIDGKYAQVLESTSHILFDNDDYFRSPSPGRGAVTAVIEELETVKSVITGTSTKVIAPATSAFYNYRSTERPLEVSYDDYQVEYLTPRKDHTTPFYRNSRVYATREGFSRENPRVEPTPTVEDPISSSPGRPSYKESATNDFLARLRQNRNSMRDRPNPFVTSDRRSSHKRGPAVSSSAAVVTQYADETTSKSDGRFHNRLGSNKRPGRFHPPKLNLNREEEEVIRTTPASPYRKGGYKNRFTQTIKPTTSSSIYKFSLNRPTGRWRWRTTSKPRVDILPDPPVTEEYEAARDGLAEDLSSTGEDTTDPPIGDYDYSDPQLEPSEPGVHTIRVSTSTPKPFNGTVYELATVRSTYVFRVGTRMNTRQITLTMTSAVDLATVKEPTIEPSDAGLDIIAAEHAIQENLIEEQDIAILPPIGLAGDASIPPLETKTETFSTEELVLRTNVLPVINDHDTSFYTLTQSYYITRIVTALKTMPPMDFYQFIPADQLIEFNSRLQLSGSEHKARLLLANEDLPPNQEIALPPDFFDKEISEAGAKFDPLEMDRKLHPELYGKKPRIHPTPTVSQTQPKTLIAEEDLVGANSQPTPPLDPAQLQQLALLRLVNPYLNIPGLGIPGTQVITTSKPIFKVETVYKTDILPVWDGKKSFQSTLTRPIGTRTKTDYELVTAEVPNAPLNPFQAPLATVSSLVTVSTRVTETSTKVYKVTLQAQPILTTVTMTSVYDTVLTTYTTSTIPAGGALPILPYPGFFG
ncbi:unnamed protein product [Darwinula stevensoni]|uniref:DUF4758 domain-containing protein n=1 Tax=Darwinula stevensoni TaxID=69355 RepID=A0A7R8WZP2_9CRUS|nr:unnamed protein product [Darwinula stevensoni]CAG0880237.1 unnamed protein product [Darwinula stevensoni]